MSRINDFSQYATLRADAIAGRDNALRDVAEQFEALFIQNMLKSMRDAGFGDDLSGPGGDLYRDMFDQQIATDIAAGPGLGFADMLVRQLGGADTRAVKGVSAVSATARADSPMAPNWSDKKSFIADLMPYAKAAARQLKVSPLAILSQAALETGWGRSVMSADNGDSSLNLFGIKAGGDWRGRVANRMTIEFEEGVATRKREPFRSYESLAGTFADYVRLLSSSDRYADSRQQGDDIAGFANALQAGGYATDPAYADKILSIAGGDVMQSALAELKQSALLTLSQQIGDRHPVE